MTVRTLAQFLEKRRAAKARAQALVDALYVNIPHAKDFPVHLQPEAFKEEMTQILYETQAEYDRLKP